MENEREEFFIKFRKEKKDDWNEPLDLQQIASKMVFYLTVNTCMNFEKTYNGNYYCTCYKYSGCKKWNGKLAYCIICQLGIHYKSYFLFSNYNIKYHIDLYKKLIEEFKENPQIEMYEGDYRDKCYNFQEGTCSEWSLFNYVF